MLLFPTSANSISKKTPAGNKENLQADNEIIENVY